MYKNNNAKNISPVYKAFLKIFWACKTTLKVVDNVRN